jgi:hypothetical protein
MNKKTIVTVLFAVSIIALATLPLANGQADVLISTDHAYVGSWLFGSTSIGNNAIEFTGNPYGIDLIEITTTFAYTPTRLIFRMVQNGNPTGTVAAEIFLVTGSTISGSPVATSNQMLCSSLGVGDVMLNNVTFVFSSAPLLKANSRYAFVAHVSNNSNISNLGYIEIAREVHYLYGIPKETSTINPILIVIIILAVIAVCAAIAVFSRRRQSHG